MKVAITGRSMEPALFEGDWALFNYSVSGLSTRALKRSVGGIVLIRRSSEPDLLVVKRLIKILDTGYWVEGDNADESTDSRHYLTLSQSEIVGRHILRYRKGKR